jgi:superfamily II DNA helicase RecQ
VRVATRNASPWLARVERALDAERATEQPPVDTRELIADARARIGRPDRARRAVSERDAALFGALVEWRRNLSRAAGSPAYVVFNNETLAAIASARPRTRRALLALPGVGPVKVERYGDAVLAMVGEHDPG